ncbi:MAG TPA: hypothetical protein VMU89_09345 [Thermomicrobiaceae bacterium]|nr:hypothetical protein [Thermomicrobiaceae bacterium]
MPWASGSVLALTVNHSGFDLSIFGPISVGLLLLVVGAVEAAGMIDRLAPGRLPIPKDWRIQNPVRSGVIAAALVGFAVPDLNAWVHGIHGSLATASLGPGLWVSGTGAFGLLWSGWLLRVRKSRGTQ